MAETCSEILACCSLSDYSIFAIHSTVLLFILMSALPSYFLPAAVVCWYIIENPTFWEKQPFVAFADFSGVNIPTVVNFRLAVWHWNWAEMRIIGSSETVWAGLAPILLIMHPFPVWKPSMIEDTENPELLPKSIYFPQKTWQGIQYWWCIINSI